MIVQTARTRRNGKAPGTSEASQLFKDVDDLRRNANSRLNGSHRAELGQFLTPPQIATLMASMFSVRRPEIRLLDPGAGVGSLTAAFVARMLDRKPAPPSGRSLNTPEDRRSALLTIRTPHLLPTRRYTLEEALSGRTQVALPRRRSTGRTSRRR